MVFAILQHKRIFGFPANEFYKQKKLCTNENIAKEMEHKAMKLKNFWPNQDPAIPFVFCDVIDTEEVFVFCDVIDTEEVTDTEYIDKIRVGQESKYNPEEANKIVRIIIM